jgi:hypothetical protein
LNLRNRTGKFGGMMGLADYFKMIISIFGNEMNQWDRRTIVKFKVLGILNFIISITPSEQFKKKIENNFIFFLFFSFPLSSDVYQRISKSFSL